MSVRALIFHMNILLDKAFPWVPTILILWPLPWSLTYLLKTFSLAKNFWTVSARVYIYPMNISIGNSFPWVPTVFIPYATSYLDKHKNKHLSLKPQGLYHIYDIIQFWPETGLALCLKLKLQSLWIPKSGWRGRFSYHAIFIDIFFVRPASWSV